MKALPVLDPKAAAIDVGSEKLHVSIAGDTPKVFGTFTGELETLRDWFKEQGFADVTVDDLYRLYGADPDEMRWFAAMSLYKYASIFGYNLMLHRRGKRPDPMYEGLTTTITGMIEEGIQLLT